MLKSNHKDLKGNDKYEGFAVDIIKKVRLKCAQKYVHPYACMYVYIHIRVYECVCIVIVSVPPYCFEFYNSSTPFFPNAKIKCSGPVSIKS